MKAVSKNQIEFGFASEVTAAWVRPLVMAWKPFNAGGWFAEKCKTATYEKWLEWCAPLGNRTAMEGGAR